MKRLIGTLLFIGLSPLAITWTIAQTIVQPKQLDYSSMGILYNEERAIEFRPHSNGGAVAFHLEKLLPITRRNIICLTSEFYAIQKNSVSPLPFIRETLLQELRIALPTVSKIISLSSEPVSGRKRYFSDKAKRKGVAVGINYQVGASIGLLKPYYLHLSRLKDDGFTDYVATERYSDETADFFLDDTKIIGPASFFKGFDEISLVPGVNARVGAHFSLGAFDKYVKAFEMGITVDAFFRRVPIMIIENNTPVFINGYLSFQLGKRQ